MAKLNIGVIGLGRMGQVYARHVANQLPEAKLVTVADPREEVLQSFGDAVSDVTPYRTHQELLAHPGLHAVIVTTPTSTHRDVVVAAARAGKHIFCEKPTALTLEATDEMLAAVNQAGVLFQVGFMRRFDEAYRKAYEQIKAGIIGEPNLIKCVGRDAGRTSLEYANPAVSGGLIVDMGIHDFDIARWLMGDEVERVYAEASSLVYPELEQVGDVDSALVNLRFKRGGLGNVEVSRTGVYGYDIRCEIVGSKGAISVGYLQHTPVTVFTREGAQYDIVPHFPQRFGTAYTRQIEHFVDCLHTDREPLVTPADARAALQIGMAAARSQQEGRVIYVDDVAHD
ncbi:MAG: inositol 2-dehydrogenase [Anaerolineae bacterium]